MFLYGISYNMLFVMVEAKTERHLQALAGEFVVTTAMTCSAIAPIFAKQAKPIPTLTVLVCGTLGIFAQFAICCVDKKGKQAPETRAISTDDDDFATPEKKIKM